MENVIGGCSHRGRVNTIRHAQRVMNRKEVYALIGEFHLSKASDGTIRETLDQLEKISPKHVNPLSLHGRRAVNRLGLAFGDGCKQVRAGDVVTREVSFMQP